MKKGDLVRMKEEYRSSGLIRYHGWLWIVDKLGHPPFEIHCKSIATGSVFKFMRKELEKANDEA